MRDLSTPGFGFYELEVLKVGFADFILKHLVADDTGQVIAEVDASKSIRRHGLFLGFGYMDGWTQTS